MSEAYFYEGDYEDLLDWIIDAYPPKMYSKEGFFAWLKDVKQNFFKDGKHFSDDIAEEMQQFWTDNNLGKIGKPDKDERKLGRAQTFNSVLDLGVFRTTDVYELNQDRKRPTLRRELQQLTKEGKIERIGKGVYRFK